MALPLLALPILSAAAKAGIVITTKTAAMITASVIAAGGVGGKAIHDHARFQGEIEGRAKQAEIDSAKFRELAEAFLRQQKTYETAKAELDFILACYEKQIEYLNSKVILNEDETTELNTLMDEMFVLKCLKDNEK